MRKVMTRFARGAPAAVAAGGLVLGLAGSAHASSNATAYVYGPDGTRLGTGHFQADPQESSDPSRPDQPGDAIMACDAVRGDSYGVRVQLDIHRDGDIDRSASAYTFGCTDWVTGNITEETPVRIRACEIVGFTTRDCGAWRNATA
ncbi:hypothetical protein [Streptomyces acidicola]|uniref:Secreted protein n=1 Tax=Streptomyces acidicola TaxID=2596892 RepID=A0A5N8WX48_9ACTN|nr:hypothetical protein [Streptomyces acidicola]MPY51138.1 hypothetical protein [Streptomyces acidicola]